MMRLPLLAAFAVAAAGLGPVTPDECKKCGEGTFCRTAVAASGGVCDAKLPKTCAKLSGRKERCGGEETEAYACFRNKCKEPLACRKTSLEAKALGTCVKQCTVELEGDKTMKVYEGWTGPALKQWCHKRYCDGSGDKDVGEVKEVPSDEVCPQSLKEGLRCCVGQSENGKNQECCGANGQWVTPVEGKVTCAGVEATVGRDLAAPFSRTCTGVCKRENAAAVDDGWKGPSTEEGKWCNTCVCARGALTCTKRECPVLKCCSPGEMIPGVEDQVCCGATGEWVAKDAQDNVVCRGVTLPYTVVKKDTPAPFHAPCGKPRTCTLFSNVPVTVYSGKTVADPRKGRGCNECTCNDGTLKCATAVCEGLKCCDAETRKGEQLCCGLTGEWVPVDGGKCGAYATQVPTKTVPETATGYPFFEACPQQCAANTAVGGPDKKLPVGWTGRKGEFVVKGMTVQPLWCDTCTCAYAEGAKPGAPPVVTCTTRAACPAANCCRGKAPADSACCGVTRQWVKVVKGEVACGGVTIAVPKPTEKVLAPLGEACATCTLPGGVVLGEGQSGADAGAHWCKRCRCEEEGKASCTKDACKRKCCSAELPKEPASAAYRCCGASGAWVAVDAATKTYRCGGAAVAADVEPLFADPAGGGTDEEKGICAAAVVPKPCTLHNEGATEVKQGWRGLGLGDKWCHTCKCRAEDAGKAVSCPDGECPKKEELKCCGAEKGKDDEVCCGLTGKWVAKGGMCGAVDLSLAGTVKAPVTDACPKCTLAGGAEVAHGWFDFAPGPNWCNKCFCAADGKLRCTTKECRKPTCCAGEKGAATDVCCGATGQWVAVGTGADAGKYACGGVKAEKADQLPFFEKCAEGCVLDDKTPVAVGWAGKKGDGCNYCYCRKDKDLLCSARVCPTPPGPPPATVCKEYNCGAKQRTETNECKGDCNDEQCCFGTCSDWVKAFPCDNAPKNGATPCLETGMRCDVNTCCEPAVGVGHCKEYNCGDKQTSGGTECTGNCNDEQCCYTTCSDWIKEFPCDTGPKDGVVFCKREGPLCGVDTCCEPIANCAGFGGCKGAQSVGDKACMGDCSDEQCCIRSCADFVRLNTCAGLPAGVPKDPLPDVPCNEHMTCSLGDCCESE